MGITSIPPENGLGWRGLSVDLRFEQPKKIEKDDRADDGPNPHRLTLLPLDFVFVGEVNGISVTYVFSGGFLNYAHNILLPNVIGSQADRYPFTSIKNNNQIRGPGWTGRGAIAAFQSACKIAMIDLIPLVIHPFHLMDSAVVNHEVIVFIEIVKNQSYNEQYPHEDGQRPVMDKDSQDDHSKEERVSYYRVFDWSQIDILVTDRPPCESIRNACGRHGVQMMY